MQHGTYVGYVVHKCRCDDCRQANNQYRKEQEHRKRTGQTYFVPAEPVRERWLLLRSKGMSDDEIERAAGIDDKVSDVLFHKHWRTGKPVTRIKRETAERIFAVRKRAMKRGNRIPAEKLHDMVLDLMEQGYSVAWLARQVGKLRSNFDPLNAESVSLDTYLKVKEVWERTTTTAPLDTHHRRAAASRARNQAKRYRKRQGDKLVRIDTAKLRELIDERPLLQVDADTGLSRGHINHIITRGGCRLSTALKLADALGVREDTLLKEIA